MTSCAVALGFAGSMRTFTPAAAFALRGRFESPWRELAVGAAAVELVTDKTRFARQRVDVPSTACRVGSGVACGGAVGAGVALVGTHVTYRGRRWLTARGVPDWRVALAEDVLAVGLAAWASARPAPAGAVVGPQ